MAQIPLKDTEVSISVNKIEAPTFSSPLESAVKVIGNALIGIGERRMQYEREMTDAQNYAERVSAHNEFDGEALKIKQEFRDDPDKDIGKYSKRIKELGAARIAKIKGKPAQIRAQAELDMKRGGLEQDLFIDKMAANDRDAKFAIHQNMNNLSGRIRESSSNAERKLMVKQARQMIEEGSQILSVEAKANYLELLDNMGVEAIKSDAFNNPKNVVLNRLKKGEYELPAGLSTVEVRATIDEFYKAKEQHAKDQIASRQVVNNTTMMSEALEIMKTADPAARNAFEDKVNRQMIVGEIGDSQGTHILSAMKRSFDVKGVISGANQEKYTREILSLAETIGKEEDVDSRRKYVAEMQRIQEEVFSRIGKDLTSNHAQNLITDIDKAMYYKDTDVRGEAVGDNKMKLSAKFPFISWVNATKDSLKIIDAGLTEPVDKNEAFDRLILRTQTDGKELEDYTEEERKNIIAGIVEKVKGSSVDKTVEATKKVEDGIKMIRGKRYKKNEAGKWVQQ